ncbi:hypothetical protein ACQKM9_17340 [Viridibacillus sp. NPDC093762]|uniref:hypothetical protein n=1 Tax=Viridibacillus sp. NPDC093762 TaxID=3390720 RepID=UPI003D03D903
MKNVYLYILMTFVGISALVAFMFLRHDANVNATQSIQPGIISTELGTVRTEGKVALDKEAVVANLALGIAKSYKGTPYKTKVDYAFLNKDGQVVTNNNSKDYVGVQFKVTLFNDDGKAVSTSTERVALKEIQ